ncbi:hypothetical protein RI129_003610 [Pyrocoelia pectoralis]|uniref:Structural maintenance of chromosomes protein 5 n=1 Tax=Pyrocoelia pectoralis TaxID=417401 RepID=A0AAN7VS93_9COLE
MSILPQDRVQDFAKLNKQQLLQQTQIAICRNDLMEKQVNLINFRERHKEIQVSLENWSKKLQELQDANIRIEGRVKNLTKKKKYTKYIEDIERKVAWIKYENLRVKLDDIKRDKIKATEALNQHKITLQPILGAVSNAEKVVRSIEQKIRNVGNVIRNHEAEVQHKLDSSTRIKSNLIEIQGDLNSRLRELDTRNEEIEKIQNEISQLNEQRSELQQLNDNQRENKIKSLNEEAKRVMIAINRDTEKKGECENSKRNKSYELRCLENELENLENVKQQRLEWLRRMDKHAYSAVQWLRNNKQIFKGPVYEPMLLELNVLNPNHAIYVENTIPFRDRVAFTCVLKEDMNMLILKLRDEQRLNVNVVHSGMERSSLHQYQPTIPIEQLKPYGMFAYIKSLLTGPEPIMQYLCKTYHIHNIPVGSSITNQRFESVPPQITNFFSDTFRFSTTYSKYTREKSTRQSEIKSDNSFSISMDAERIENIRGQLIEGQQSCRKVDDQISSLNNQINQNNHSLATIRQNLQGLKKVKQDLDALESRMRILKNKLQQIQHNQVTKEDIERECHAQINHAVDRLVSVQKEVTRAFSTYSKVMLDADLDQINLDTNRKQIIFLKNKSKDLETLCRKTEETLNVIKATYSSVIAEGKLALTKAKQLSNGLTPNDEGFNVYKEVYDNLPNDLAQLESDKDGTLAKIDCLSTADDAELGEYHKRQELIVKYENDIEQGHAQLNNTNCDMEKLEKEWLEPLEELVQEINLKFSNAFRRMGCAGEISIYKGTNEKDYSEYGLSIKVKYRDSEPLQELNNIVQSGGERAVATAAFMLSLQELTPVPFRCVDEINQGMDSNNERRIFELLVDATTQSDTSQYFFITPKLVPNLKFVQGITVHIVHNGPFVSSQKKWNNAFDYVKKVALQN